MANNTTVFVTPVSPVFAGAFWIIGGVATAIWANEKGKKGKFWWFMGGALIGGAIGGIIDYSIAKQQ